MPHARFPQTSPAAIRRTTKARNNHSCRNQSWRLDPLETRQLLSTVSISSFGAIANDGNDDYSAISSAISAAGSGGTVMIPTGTYNLFSTLSLPSGVSLQGTKGSKLDFVTNRSAFAVNIANGASNIRIDGIAFKANDGIFALNGGSGYTNIAFTNNDFEWGYDGTYYHRLAIQSTSHSSGIIIEKNFFHDSIKSDRNVDLWGMSNASYSYNTFYMVNDGGHICNSGHNVTFSYNYGRKIHRMGVEIQTWSGDTTNLTVQGNTFFDWYHPYTDSFGLSIMPQSGHNVKILDNYVAATFDGVWGNGVDGKAPHFGIGIEAGFTTGIVQNNTVVGPFVFGIICSMPNTLVQGNRIYGNNAYGSLTTEGGLTGGGSFISVNNIIDKDQSHAPPPPPPVDGVITDFPPPDTGLPTDPTGPLSPPPTGIAPYLTAFVADTTSIVISWGDSYSDETGYRVERSSDGKLYQQVYETQAQNMTYSYTDHGLRAGTLYYYRVHAYHDDADAGNSNVVGAKTRPGPGGSAPLSVHNSTQPNDLLPPPVPTLNKDWSDFSDTLITTV